MATEDSTARGNMNCNVITDIWMIHSQIIATLATCDRLAEEVAEAEASDELPVVRNMLRDMKRKLEIFATEFDTGGKYA